MIEKTGETISDWKDKVWKVIALKIIEGGRVVKKEHIRVTPSLFSYLPSKIEFCSVERLVSYLKQYSELYRFPPSILLDMRCFIEEVERRFRRLLREGEYTLKIFALRWKEVFPSIREKLENKWTYTVRGKKHMKIFIKTKDPITLGTKVVVLIFPRKEDEFIRKTLNISRDEEEKLKHIRLMLSFTLEVVNHMNRKEKEVVESAIKVIDDAIASIKFSSLINL